MLTKLLQVFVIVSITTLVVCSPIESHDDEDIPVYTEKVSPAKPTKPGRSAPRVPRFESKKLSSGPKKSPTSFQPEAYIQPSPQLPPKPRTDNSRPIRKVTSHVPNTIVDNEYPSVKPALKRDYSPPRTAYSSNSDLGVHYSQDDVPRVDHGLVDDYTPRKLSYQIPPDYGTAAGNEQKLRYVPAPQRLSAAPATYKEDYDVSHYDEKPQPYIFGYELKDENGSTQSRKEQGDDHGNKRGSYGYTDGYGIYREVEYVADAHGFRAVVKTNEPGTENQNPADVEILSEAGKY